MNKQEQIKEMAIILYKKMILDANEYEKDCFTKYAEALYNAGYRKADEVRKETAKKIFDALYQWLDLENTEKCGFATIQKFDFLSKFRELYQQLGIEQKE